MTRLDRLTERLNLKEFQLRALLEVTKAINANVHREDLLRLYGEIMQHELGITRLMLFERQAQWECILAFGTQGEEATIDVDAAAGNYTDIQLIGTDPDGRMAGFDIAVPVNHEDRPLAFLFIGDIDEGTHMSPTVKHLNFIQTLTNLIVVALENQRLNHQALQQERDKRELELAAEMQAMLVPDALPHTGPLHAAAWYQPHRQVGGDYYDVVRTSDREAVIVIADVSGKGIAAALLMSNFQATLRALVQYSDDPLDELVHDLNDKVFHNARGERFITAFVGRLDLASGSMHFVNAGHNPPLLLADGAFEELTTGSIALGMMPKLPFLQVGEARVLPGSTLLCYTDGLVEQEDVHGNAFGTGPLRRTMLDLQGGTPEDLVQALVARFSTHRGAEPYLDDLALLACRRA
ncbi:MAG: SpoIIE family protein phosphatase [Flavobacteriales bacterium]|nr:SpoIIE family protein phosphatase [Flavobacteriales bacterium]